MNESVSTAIGNYYDWTEISALEVLKQEKELLWDD